jgi:hypothetical protein
MACHFKKEPGAVRARLAACGAAFACVLGAVPAWAAAPAAGLSGPGAWSAGLLAAEALNHNLPDLLPKAFRGELDFEPAHLRGIVLRRGLTPPGFMADWGAAHDIPVSTSLELSLLHSNGLADNSELALDWRPAFTPWRWGPVSFELAWGLGISHSFGQPWSDYTDPDRPEGYRTLFHMAPEIAFQHQELPGWSLSLRLHHRSGFYGLFGPRRVGSNHLGLVLMREF